MNLQNGYVQKKSNFDDLEDSAFDPLMGEASGGGIIFGNTGGVMEAAMRAAYKLANW